MDKIGEDCPESRYEEARRDRRLPLGSPGNLWRVT
jgi:hypothetical protein